ncbi:MAG: hypothetical protein C5B51_09840 [Terriglobia bacterium]|nr:MAG: hypothetical protein C5B51_09840 [Terriglobia bacterium]
MKAKGLLTVVGTLDIRQFWPASKGAASSDGDTAHLKVDPNTSFLFLSPGASKPKVTRKFIGAAVNDHGKLKKVITAKSEIKIRFQGIDTPELHYPVIATFHPSKRGKFMNEFRQPFGAGAANALHEHLTKLAGAGGDPLIPARFVTQINRPNDAVDSHGRFVGDIIIGTAAAQSLNTWLVENGWAHPLLYDSMTPAEVQTILNAWKKGKAIKDRPGKSFHKPLLPFDPQQNVNNAKLPDGGQVNFPKVFRRQATFWAQVAGPLTEAEFVKMINKGITGKPDRAYPTDYFLKNFDKLDPKKRVTFASQIGTQGQALFTPADLVFQEDPATLLDSEGNPVKGW